jgi:hypothetical protein
MWDGICWLSGEGACWLCGEDGWGGQGLNFELNFVINVVGGEVVYCCEKD